MPPQSLRHRMADSPDDVEAVLAALRQVRIVQAALKEVRIHEILERALKDAGIDAKHEQKIGPRCRPDFFTAGGTVIEVKKKRPNATATLKQLEKYARLPHVKAVVLVAERGLSYVPAMIGCKRVAQVTLYGSWGVAV